MRRTELIDLLKQRPGYEVVYLLMQGDRRREELAAYAGRDGGTLERWLDGALRAGLIEKRAVLHDGTAHVGYALACSIPADLHEVIEDRGGQGPRDECYQFADTAGIHHWRDGHTFDS